LVRVVGISDVKMLYRSGERSLPSGTPAWIGKREERELP